MKSSPSRTSLRSQGEWAAAVVLSALAYLFLLAWIDPSGDFPLNDDHAYVWSVRQLLQNHVFRLSEWTTASSLIQVLWGALFAIFGGLSHSTLRLANVTMSWASATCFFLLLRSLGIGRARACLGALLLITNPIFLTTSFNFTTDVTYLTLLSGSILCFARGLREPVDGSWLLAGAAVSILAVLTRQFGILAPIGAAAVLWRRGRRGRELVWVLAPPVAALVLFEAWFYLVQGGNWVSDMARGWLLSQWSHPWGLFCQDLYRLAAAACYLGLFLLPLAAGLLAERFWRQKLDLGEALGMLFLVFLGVWMAARYGAMPYLLNTIHRQGLGIVSLHGYWAKATGWWGYPAFWAVLTGLGLTSFAILFRLAYESRRRGAESSDLAWLVFPQIAPFFLLPEVFDRYLLPAFAGTAAWVLLASRDRKIRLPVAVAACAAMGLASVVGLRDYFAWHRAAATEAARALEAGFPPGRIDNGFDWNADRVYAENIRRLLSRKPRKDIGLLDWTRLEPKEAIVSFAAISPEPGFVLLDRVEYLTPLSKEPRFVYLHARRDLLSPRARK